MYKISEFPEFDAAKYLDSAEEIAEYITVILEENDSALLASALGDRGMAKVAKDAGLTRAALYKALRPNASPRFDTINRVCQSLGVKLVVQSIKVH